MSVVLEEAVKYWSHVEPLLHRPRDDDEYERMVSYLDELLAIVGDREDHQLMGLVDLVSDLIEAYEEQTLEEPKCKGVDALRMLMAMHDLRQSDLPEIGSQGVVSEILNEHRVLNLRQIKALAERFKVSPETFLDG